MDDVEVIRMTPDDLGYKDRGIMKWQGLILADHNEALKKMDTDQTEGPPKVKKNE